MKVDRYKVHNIEVVVDRIVLKKNLRSRVADSVELALRIGDGVLMVHDGAKDQLFSQKYACHHCGLSYEEPAPNSFSFNTPSGYCPHCEGLGELKAFDLGLIIPDRSKSINEEAIAPFGKPRSTWMFSQIEAVAARCGFDFDTPLKDLSKDAWEALLNGTGKEKLDVKYRHSSGRVTTYKHRYEGLLSMLQRYYDETTSNKIRDWVESFMATTACKACGGGRLRPESLAIKLVDAQTGEAFSIHDTVKGSITRTSEFFAGVSFTDRQMEIARPILKEIQQRLSFLLNVGLDYLSLDRSARTLSGGEGQRIRLATQIGTQLVGVLYILDEPSIGLHQRDNRKLIDSLKSLRDLGNTVIVVEHDKEMIESSDFVIDLGPGAGEHGGRVVLTGSPAQLGNGAASRAAGRSLTANYLRGAKSIAIPAERRIGSGDKIVLTGARGNNLQSVTFSLPLGTFICVTGVSGSGKSTLVNETLYPILSREFYKSRVVPLPHDGITGLDKIDKVIDIDQTPIGRTPRSNPATYTGVFTLIRDLFTMLPESQIRGYKPGRFSFNVKGGRCEHCEGDGLKKIEMNFLPDVYVVCDVCNGKRYNRETLEVHFKGKSIAEVLDMTVEDALALFEDLPRIKRHLRTLNDVGLGYIKLGQHATTLSGGEAQRVKLATELSKVGTGKTLYILDEPTTGLHFEDIRMLLDVLNKLVDKGNTVLVIEHNLDVIKTADWIVDLGPEGGDAGGTVVAKGTPEAVAAVKNSYTGQFLMNELGTATGPGAAKKRRRRST